MNTINNTKQRIIFEKLQNLAALENESNTQKFFSKTQDLKTSLNILTKKNQSNSLIQEKSDSYYTKNFENFRHFLTKRPINLLFSLDQFMFEFSKNKSQQQKSSEFQKLLKEQKKLTLFYGNLSTKEFKKIIHQALKYQGYFYRNFFSLLEKRLDVVLYRCGFAKTISGARQLIIHNKILLNNKVITIPSYSVQPGDCISVHQNFINSLSTNTVSSLNILLKKHRNPQKAIIYRILKQRINNNKIKKTQKSYKNVTSLVNLLLQNINIWVSKKNLFVSYQKKPLFIGLNNAFPLNKIFAKKQYFKQTQHKSNKLTKNQKKNNSIFQNLILKTVSLLRSQKLFKPFLIPVFKKQIFLKRFSSFINFKRNIKSLNFGGLKPLHLETSYRLLKTIYLYSPQRVKFPFYVNIDLLSRAFR